MVTLVTLRGVNTAPEATVEKVFPTHAKNYAGLAPYLKDVVISGTPMIEIGNGQKAKETYVSVLNGTPAVISAVEKLNGTKVASIEISAITLNEKENKVEKLVSYTITNAFVKAAQPVGYYTQLSGNNSGFGGFGMDATGAEVSAGSFGFGLDLSDTTSTAVRTTGESNRKDLG